MSIWYVLDPNHDYETLTETRKSVDMLIFKPINNLSVHVCTVRRSGKTVLRQQLIAVIAQKVGGTVSKCTYFISEIFKASSYCWFFKFFNLKFSIIEGSRDIQVEDQR